MSIKKKNLSESSKYLFLNKSFNVPEVKAKTNNFDQNIDNQLKRNGNNYYEDSHKKSLIDSIRKQRSKSVKICSCISETSSKLLSKALELHKLLKKNSSQIRIEKFKESNKQIKIVPENYLEISPHESGKMGNLNNDYNKSFNDKKTIAKVLKNGQIVKVDKVKNWNKSSNYRGLFNNEDKKSQCGSKHSNLILDKQKYRTNRFVNKNKNRKLIFLQPKFDRSFGKLAERDTAILCFNYIFQSDTNK